MQPPKTLEEATERWEAIQRELDRKYEERCAAIHATFLARENYVKVHDADQPRIMDLGLEQLRNQLKDTLRREEEHYLQTKHEQTEAFERIHATFGNHLYS